MGTCSNLLETAQGRASHRDSRAPFCLDVGLLNRPAHLAPLDRSRSQRSVATRQILLSGKRLDDRDHLVLVHLGRNHRSRH